MTHPDDETLTAVLDGETGPDDRAHVEGCAECDNRLEQLRRAAALAGTPVPALDELRREAVIRRALAVHDGRRASRSRPPAWAWSAVAAAAVVLVAGIAIGQSGGGDGGDGDDRVASAPEAAVDADAFSTGASEGDGSGGEAADESMAMAAPAGGDLGELAGADLAAVLAPYLERPPAAGDDLAEPPCHREAAADVGPGAQDIWFVGSGTFEGRPVTVIVLGGRDGRHARVLDQSCAVVLRAEV